MENRKRQKQQKTKTIIYTLKKSDNCQAARDPRDRNTKANS